MGIINLSGVGAICGDSDLISDELQLYVGNILGVVLNLVLKCLVLADRVETHKMSAFGEN